MSNQSQSLSILDSVNSIRVKTLEVDNTEGKGFWNFLPRFGMSSPRLAIEVTEFKKNPNGNALVSESGLFGAVLEKEFLYTQNEKINFYDDNQCTPLQMEFKNNSGGFPWLQNHMELHVSTNGLALGKIIYEPEKDAYNIEDYAEPSVCCNIVQTTGGASQEFSNNYTIKYSTSPHSTLPQPQCQSQPRLLSMEAEIKGDESPADGEIQLLISFQDKDSNKCQSQTFPNQAKALLIGLMTFMIRVATGKRQRRIHNEAAHKSSTILLPH